MGPEQKEMVNEKKNCGGKYLTFILKEEVYGIEILKVQEIIGMMTVTVIPQTPSFIRGVINLRGKVIPVVDLRVKFNLEEKKMTEKTCIVVVKIQKGKTAITIGLIVDEVSEVLNIASENIDPPPSFGTAVELNYITGIGKMGQKVILLLDVDEVIVGSEFAELKKAA